MKHSWQARALLLLFGIALIAGLLTLTSAYSAAGNGYAEYSSLRTDPKGAKVLYDALSVAGTGPVSRNYSDLHDLKASDAAIFILGFSETASDELEALEKRALGNRLIIALATEDELTRWGVRLTKFDDDGTCGFRFARAEGWTKVNDCAVERSFGSGHIVLLADPGPLTNEGLVVDRDAQFLAHLAGTSSRIIFDESHLGMVETGSAVGLARKYRLQGLLWGFALLAGVFIWRTAEPFPPPPAEDADHAPFITGRDAQTGFLRLLERHIPPARLMEECVRQWRLTSPRKDLPVAAPLGDPVAAYRAIQKDLTP